MAMRSDFEERAGRIADAYLTLASDFLSSRPLGSFVTMEQYNAVMRQHRVEFKDLQAYMADNTDRAFWVASKQQRIVGFFILSRDAVRQFNNLPVMS